MTREEFFELVEDEFAVKPDYPFNKDFVSAVFRHKSNRKWFALLMQVPKNRLGFDGTENVEVLNLKCEPLFRTAILQNKGVIESYHMNKIHWISILIEEVDTQVLKTLLEISFQLTDEKPKQKRRKE